MIFLFILSVVEVIVVLVIAILVSHSHYNNSNNIYFSYKTSIEIKNITYLNRPYTEVNNYVHTTITTLEREGCLIK